jgi:hypothetical protein
MRSEAQTLQQTQHCVTSCESEEQVGFAVVEGLSTNNKERSRRPFRARLVRHRSATTLSLRAPHLGLTFEIAFSRARASAR